MPKRIDAPWVLGMLYALLILVSLPLQQRIWRAIALEDGPNLLDVAAPLAMLWCLFGAGIAAAAWLAPRTSDALARGIAARLSRCQPCWVIAVTVAALIAGLAIARFVLDRFPNSGDEYAYLFQARQFAHGRLWAEAPPLGYTFVPYRTWITAGKWVSQYPPGWPLVLAFAMVPPWSVNAFLGALSVLALAARSWRFPDTLALILGLILYGLTPFYLLTAGSLHSHMFSALLIVLLCLACRRAAESGRALPLLAAGALLGLVGITRYFSLVLVVPALSYWFFVEFGYPRLRGAVLIVLGGAPFLALLMAYQSLVTGSPFHSSYAVMAVPDVSVSFAPYDVLSGLVATWYRLVELGTWASPTLVAIYLVCFDVKRRRGSLAFYDLIFPTFVVGFIFFPSLGGNRYGPRYYFEAFPLMLATIVSAAPLATAWARVRWGRPLAAHATAGSVVYLATALPFALLFFHQQVEAHSEPYRLVAERGLKNAIVVLESTSGPGFLEEDLARNRAALDAPVLYARDTVAVSALERAFPGRSIWTYERADPDHPGRLAPLSSVRP